MLVVTKSTWAGGKVCVDLQAVGALEFFGELYSLVKGFYLFLRGFGQVLEKGRVLFFSHHQHFAVSTGICGVACPLPASRVDKPCNPPPTPHTHTKVSPVTDDKPHYALRFNVVK